MFFNKCQSTTADTGAIARSYIFVKLCSPSIRHPLIIDKEFAQRIANKPVENTILRVWRHDNSHPTAKA